MKPVYNKNIIVIVDDEPQILRSLKWEIEIAPFNEALQIETFEATQEALDFLAKNSEEVFLLISDLRIPSPSLKGSDLLLHVHQEYPEIILILLTAYSDLDEIQKAITAEIQALIFKPWTSGMLVSEIIKARQISKLRSDNKRLRNRVSKQLTHAGEFQRQLLSPFSLRSKNLKIDFRYEPLKEYKCGGDYYDFIQIDASRDLVLAGDVSGHGIKAAFVTGIIKSFSLSIIASNPNFSTNGFLDEMNAKLCEILKPINDVLVTFSVLLFDFRNQTASYSNAGHIPLYRIRDGKSKKFWHEGQAMGFNCENNYSVQSIDIKQNDRYILLSDGLIESERHSGLLEDDIIKRELDSVGNSDRPTDKLFENFRKYHTGNDYTDDVLIATVDFVTDNK